MLIAFGVNVTASEITTPPMKKNTKSAKTPAPVKKTAAPFPPPAAVTKEKPPSPARKTAAPFAPAAKISAPVVKAVAPKSVVTVISAKIDIGFGNSLYLRGEGAGLSWDRGLLLDCVGDDHWTIKLGESARPIVFKFLVNDLSWSAGEDYVVTPGSKAAFEPSF